MKTMNFVAIDFEIANRHEDVCQVGIVKVENGEIVKEYSRYIQPPDNHYENNYVQRHGITPDMTRDCPSFAEVWEEIRSDVEFTTLVAHAAEDADARYLRKNFERHGIMSMGVQPMQCTYRIYGHGLAALCAGFSIDYTNHHDALFDARCCATFYLNHLQGVKPDAKKIAGYKKVKQPRHGDFSGKKISAELLTPDKSVSSDSLFFNRKVVITGDFDLYPDREELGMKLRALGADIDTGISKYTSYIVVGKNPGPEKMRKANTLVADGCTIVFLMEDDLVSIFAGDVVLYRLTDDLVNFKVKPKKLIDYKYILKNSKETVVRLMDNEISLYGKEVYFTKRVKGDAGCLYQSLGNIGCYANLWNETLLIFDEQGAVVSAIVVGECDLDDLKAGIVSDEIADIQRRVNMPNSALYSVLFLTVGDLIGYLDGRFKWGNDTLSMGLIEKYRKSAL